MRYVLILLLLCSCRMPDYVETEVYTQRGDGRFDRPVSNFEEETYGLGFTTGWLLGANHAAVVNLSRLDVNKSGELMMHDLHDQGETVVNVEQTQDQQADAEAEESSTLPLPPPPKTMEEAWIYLLSIAGLCGLLYIASALGIKLPFLKKNGENKK